MMTPENIDAVTQTTEAITRMQADLQARILRQQHMIRVALAYLMADQPHLAKLVLEGMEP